MISRLIESKPQDLRVFIEEAAGISKYKERRRETVNRIRHTQDNLERLNDVRDELGKQLEKLQRQAAAATRYKTLRAQARELKGQLAALRFLKNSEHIEALQKQQQALQLEVDDLVARLQGDEAGLESYKTKQLETKQTIDDLQQQLFTTSNAITRLEQNALHAKQRKGQVEQELARISEQHELLNHSIDEAQEALAVSNEALENIEPEFALKEAELEHAKERFEDAEQALREFNAQARAQEQTYNQLRQNVQQCHSQIQSTMSMQLRTSQRISELQDELKQLDEEDFASQITLLEEQCSELDFDIDEAKQLLQESNQKVSQQQGEVNAIEAKRRDVQGQLQTALSTKAALEALQQDASNNEDVIEKVLKADNFEIHSLKFKNGQVSIVVTNTKFRSTAQAVGRVASTLQRFTSDDIEVAHISFNSQGLRTATYRVNLDKITTEQLIPSLRKDQLSSIRAIDAKTLQNFKSI